MPLLSTLITEQMANVSILQEKIKREKKYKMYV